MPGPASGGTPTPGPAAGNNTGGGGGGAGYNGNPQGSPSGNGGSGIVWVKKLAPKATGVWSMKTAFQSIKAGNWPT